VKAIHDKVNSILSKLDLDIALDGMLTHANVLCVMRYKSRQGAEENEAPRFKEEEEKEGEEEETRRERRRKVSRSYRPSRPVRPAIAPSRVSPKDQKIGDRFGHTGHHTRSDQPSLPSRARPKDPRTGDQAGDTGQPDRYDRPAIRYDRGPLPIENEKIGTRAGMTGPYDRYD
jgi:hypothetical protein